MPIPTFFNPFVWGYAHERGAGPGLGANLNIPLPKGTGDDDYIKAIGEAEKTIRAFAPGALVVALGLDASEHDPLAGLAVTTAGFRRIGAAIAGLAFRPFSFRREAICPISSAPISPLRSAASKKRVSPHVAPPRLLAGVARCPVAQISTLAKGRSRLTGAMQRRKVRMLSALRALLAPFWSYSRERTAAQRDATDRSASPLLVYVAAALFVILSILIVDLHRDELRALGLVGGAERINPVFMSP